MGCGTQLYGKQFTKLGFIAQGPTNTRQRSGQTATLVYCVLGESNSRQYTVQSDGHTGVCVFGESNPRQYTVRSDGHTGV